MSPIQLRPFEDSDLPLFEGWIYLPHVAKWYHDPLDWLEEVKERKGAFSFLHHLIVEQDGRAIGFGQFYAYCHSHEDWHGEIEIEGTYSIDYLIGEVDFLGKGLGRAIVGELVARIKEQADAKRIIVQPEPENMASCGVLCANGFVYDAKNELYLLTI